MKKRKICLLLMLTVGWLMSPQFVYADQETEASLILYSRLFLIFAGLFVVILIFLLIRLSSSLKQQRTATAELSKNRKMLHDVIDTIHVGVIWKDRDGKFLGCNRHVAQDAGYLNPESLIGMDDTQLPWSAHAERYRADELLVMKSGKARINYEEPQTTPDGRKIWLRTSKIPLRNEEGIIYGVLGTFEDITEKKRLEQMNQSLVNVIRQSPDFIGIASLDKDATFLNPAGQALVGLDSDEDVLRTPTADFFMEEDLPYAKETIYPTLLSEGRWSGEYRFRHFKTGKPIPILFDLFLSEDAVTGQLTNITTISRDISERKRAEKLIDEARKQIEAKNKELEQLVYVASHDLRSPLVNVDGFSRELEYSFKDVRDKLDHGTDSKELKVALEKDFVDMGQSIAHIRNSTAQMDRLLKGLLKLSRAGRTALWISRIDMDDLMGRISSSFAFRLREEGILLTVDQLPPCQGDSVQVTQVFSNLIDNAIKYRDKQRPCVIHIQGAADGNRVFYQVEDNGQGIADNHLGKIFELFFRLNPTETDGDGLGLTMTKQALMRINGDISVTSKQGEGTKFTITLPAVSD